ncbi:MAG: RcnB family protein [Asticcacaulis sp.]
MKILICAGLAAGLLSSAALAIALLPAGASAQSQEAASRAQINAQIRDSAHDQVRDHAADRTSGTISDSSSLSSTQTRMQPGDRVGEDNRHDGDVVVDWEMYNLQSPPSGYSWLRHDGSGQYLLTSMRTGIVREAIDQGPERGARMARDGRGPQAYGYMPQNRNQDQNQGQNQGQAQAQAQGMNPDHRDGERNDRQPSGSWSRGDRVPDAYRDDDHAVSGWRDLNLRAPAPGYAWIRNDNGQYVLASRRTGQISDVVDQDHYRSDYVWNRGDRLSGGYLDPRFTVTGWRAARLPRPAPGLHWVRINGHYMLTSIRTGQIRDIREMH